jgi:predicted DNA-binding protein
MESHHKKLLVMPIRLHKKLKELANKKGVTLTYYIIEVLKQHLRNQNK